MKGLALSRTGDRVKSFSAPAAMVLVDRAGGTIPALSEVPMLDGRDVSVDPNGMDPLGDVTLPLDLAAGHAQAMPS
jgi:hypothetical protein